MKSLLKGDYAKSFSDRMRQSLSQNNLKKFDKSSMLDLLLDFPRQCRAALSIADSSRLVFQKKDFKKIVFFGMGGSAIGADLVKSYLYFGCKDSIEVLREYDAPDYVDSSTLVFVSSYSGNTKETLNAYRKAREKQATIIVFSSGGQLKELAQKDNVMHVEMPGGLPPRCAIGYSSIVPLCILAKLGIIEDVKLFVNEAVRVMEDLRNNCLRSQIPQSDNIAKSVAQKLFNKFAVIYSGSLHFAVCATRFRGQLAENAKALSSSHFFPEMGHNEIVGWQNPKKIIKNCAIVLLRDKDMHPFVAKSMDATKELFKKQNGPDIIEIWSRGENVLSKIFSLIYIGDFISYYLAILYGVDPSLTENITYLKERLAGELL